MKYGQKVPYLLLALIRLLRYMHATLVLGLLGFISLGLRCSNRFIYVIFFEKGKIYQIKEVIKIFKAECN